MFSQWIKQRGFNGGGVSTFTICPPNKPTHTPSGKVVYCTAMCLKVWKKPKSGRVKKQTRRSISGTSVCSVHTHTHNDTEWKCGLTLWAGSALHYVFLPNQWNKTAVAETFTLPQRSSISTAVVQTAKRQRSFCLPTSEHTSSLWAAPPEPCDRLKNGRITVDLLHADISQVQQTKHVFFIIIIFHFCFICRVKCILFSTNTNWLKTFAL